MRVATSQATTTRVAGDQSEGDSPSVLFINRVYPPAGGATGAVLAELAGGLANRGWAVRVLTGSIAGEPADRVTEAGVRVHRVRRLTFTRASHWRRALAYGTLYPTMFRRALQLPRPDIIVTKTDPPLQFVLGAVLSRLKGSAAIHWAQDLYPEIAEALDVFPEEGILARLLRRVSTQALRGHDHIVAVGRCMRTRLQQRGLDADRISVIPNWPSSNLKPVPRTENSFRHEHDLDGRFVVMYSGNMGLAHPFDAILDAAARLCSDEPDIRFLFIGDGPRRDWIKAQVQVRGLRNVRFLPFQPRDRLDESLSAADLHLVSMRVEARGCVVPSKVYGALAAGRPCIFLGPPRSEAARVLREHQCGTVLKRPSGAQLAAQIRSWRDHPARRQQAGARARAAVRGAREASIQAFEDVFQQVLEQTG